MNDKLAYIFTTLGIFMLVLCTLSGASIESEYNSAEKAYGAGGVSAYLKGSPEKGSKAISAEDILHLQQFSFRDMAMAYASVDKSTVAYGENQVQADISGVSDGFGRFHRIPMKSGSFFTAGSYKEMAAVVDEQLAIGLFGNTDVLGLYLELYGQHFKIIGVAAEDASIAGIMADDGYGTIYIPVEHMLMYNDSALISSVEIRAEGIGATEINSEKMKEGLASIGQNADLYRIIDHETEREIFGEEAEAAAFLPGISLLLILLGSIKGRLLAICSRIKKLNKEYYPGDVLRLGYGSILLNLLEISAISVLAVWIWDTISFRLYIPADYIPDELIDLGFYLELAKSLMEKKVQGLGSIPAPAELKSGILGMLQGWNLAASVFAGFLPYLLGLRLLDNRQENRTGHLLYSFISIALSVAICLLVLELFKMPIEIDNRKLMVVSAYILLSVMDFEEGCMPADRSRN